MITEERSPLVCVLLAPKPYPCPNCPCCQIDPEAGHEQNDGKPCQQDRCNNETWDAQIAAADAAWLKEQKK